jgi:hypothetical protein
MTCIEYWCLGTVRQRVRSKLCYWILFMYYFLRKDWIFGIFVVHIFLPPGTAVISQASLSKASHRPGQERFSKSGWVCHVEKLRFLVVFYKLYIYNVHCTFTLPCIVHVYPQQDKRGIQHVCLGSHVAKRRKLRPQNSKGAEKNTCRSCIIYSCTHVSHAGPNLKRIYKKAEFF